MIHRWSWRLIAMMLFAVLAMVAAPAAFASGPSDALQQNQVDNQACLACHGSAALTVKLASGETLSMYVNEAAFKSSTHSKQATKCTDCHPTITGYPHAALTAKDAREVTLQMYTVCKDCHAKNYQDMRDSIHGTLLAAGNRNAAVCTDCHSAHAISTTGQPRASLALTCQKCHSAIYDQYKGSVHGAALIDSANTDVPTCVDCHGVHTMSDPRTAAFRLKSPAMCAKCHTDSAMMAKYKLSTDVLNTYVADFHGTTVEMFEKASPDAATNKAVCYDCHGVHDIRKADDPKSSIFRENLLKTCQQCHPDATTNFPSSWLMHYRATPDQFPFVYYVNLFYTILIPLVIGAMTAYVLLDAVRRILNRLQKKGA